LAPLEPTVPRDKEGSIAAHCEAGAAPRQGVAGRRHGAGQFRKAEGVVSWWVIR
jgi:hypothetical protein